MSFDPGRQLRIRYDNDARTLRSEGLAAVGRAELAIDSLAAPLARDGAALFNVLAPYLADVDVRDNAIVCVPHAACAVYVRLVPHEGGLRRVVDAYDLDDRIPYTALTTMKCWRAEELVAHGRVADAVIELEDSLAWSTIPVYPSPEGLAHPYNHGGSQAARRLATLDLARADLWRAQAAFRNPTPTGRLPTPEEDLAFYSEGLPVTEAKPDLNQLSAYLAAGKVGESMYCVNRLLAADPDLPAAWRIRGDLLVERGRHREAFVAYHRGAAIGGPAAKGTLGGQITCLVALGRLDDAAAWLEGFANALPAWADAEELLNAGELVMRHRV